MDALDQLIVNLVRDVDVATERLRLARELRATYDANTIDALGPSSATPIVVPARRKAKPAQVACPDCGQLFARQGLGVHRARKHPSSAAKPVELRPVPSLDADAARERAAAAAFGA